MTDTTLWRTRAFPRPLTAAVRCSQLLAGLALAAMILPGCASVYRADDVLEDGGQKKRLFGLRSPKIDPINLDTYVFREDRVPEAKSGEAKPAEAKPAEPKPGEAKPGELAYAVAARHDVHRNRLQTVIMQRSDSICEYHRGDIYGTASNFNLGLAITTSGLAGAAAVVGTVLTKSALAAGAAFTSAVQAELNEHVYQKLFVGTIIKAIDTARAQKAEAIATNRRKTIGEYTVDDAIREAVEYHQFCSFYAGLVRLNESIEKERAAAATGALTRDELLARTKTLREEINKAEADRKTAEDNKKTAEVNQFESIKRGLIQQLEKVYQQLGTTK